MLTAPLTRRHTESGEYAIPCYADDGRLWTPDGEPLPVEPPDGFDDGEIVLDYTARHVHEAGDGFTPPNVDVDLRFDGASLRNGHGRPLRVSSKAADALWEMFSGAAYNREIGW